MKKKKKTEQAHVYSYAQACTYPLFFGLDSPAPRSPRTHSICNPQARRRKTCHPVGIKNLRTVADLLLPPGTALCLTISGLPTGTGIRQTGLNSQIAGLPCGITNALAKTALAGTSVDDPACRSHPLRLYEGEWIFWKGTAARILCIYSGEIGGGTACAQIHHLDPKTGRLLPTDLDATPLITLPACQPISIRCATWGGGSDEPSELASTSLSTAPHYPNLLRIKSAQTTWLRKATPIHILLVKTVKQALTSRQWQPPRTMAPAAILFEDIAPNSSSPAFRASQIRRVFTATKLPSLPATLRELWYRVPVSGFVMGENKAKGDARYCGHCERTHIIPHQQRPPL